MTPAERRARAWRTYNSQRATEATKPPEARETAPCSRSCEFAGCGCKTDTRTA